MKWFTSDWHLGHNNILKLGEGRPFKNIEQMHSILLKNAWEIMSPEDELWNLGDMAMGNFEKTIKLASAFPGNKKFLIPGNHDKIFPKLNTDTRIKQYLPMYENAGYKVLKLQEKITLTNETDNIEVLLSHIPYLVKQDRKKTRQDNRKNSLAFASPEDKGYWLIHGHTHNRNKYSSHPKELQIGVDANNFYPVSEIELIKRIKNLL